MTTARLLIAVVEEESISAAAQREHIAASAISKRISELEQAVGLPLLQRHRRGVLPTQAGLVVLRRARSMIHEAAQLDADLAEIRAGLSGKVRLCANETALIDFIPDLLPSFLDSHPGVQVELQEETSAGVVRSIWQNAADIGVYAGEVPPLDLWRRPVFSDRLVLVMKPDHTLATRNSVTMGDILAHEVIGQASGGALAALLNRAASTYSRILRVRLFADGYDTVGRLVEKTNALGIVSQSSAAIYAPQMQLRIVDIADNWAAREHQVCVRQLDTLGAAQRSLLDHLIQSGHFGSI